MKSLILFLLLCPLTWATNAVYLAATSAGANDGSSCANAKAYTYFSDVANWSGTPSGIQIGPDTTVHICGTITGTGNDNLFAFRGSGTSGHPIIFLFETNAILQDTYFSGASGAVFSDTNDYLTIDGASNGLIQNTANGTALANRQASRGITLLKCNNCEVKNLTIANIYVHVQCELGDGSCDSTVDDSGDNGIYGSGTNFLVHDNTLHDASWMILLTAYTSSNIQIYNNNIYNMDHGVACSVGGAGVVMSSLFIYNNHFHDMANWDDGDANSAHPGHYHHNGIHCFGDGLGKWQNAYFWNNLFDGLEGTPITHPPTAWIYMEGGSPWTDGTGTAYIWNNIINASDMDTVFNGQIAMGNAGTGHTLYNNTIFGTPVVSGQTPCIQVNAPAPVIKNNALSGCSSGILMAATATTPTLDYNVYANAPSSPPVYWNWTGTYSGSTFSSWKSASSQDSHSQASLAGTMGIDGNGVPQSGSMLILTGVNLTSSCTGNLAVLCQDKNGIMRPNSAWDVGALQFGSTPITLPAPSGLFATVVGKLQEGRY